MGHFTPEKAEQIKQYVLDCTIQRRTILETQAYVKQTLHLTLSSKTIKNYRARNRLQAQSWIAKLARSKRGDYISCYKERIDEIMQYQKNCGR